jgi:hypothetical protein
MVGFLKTAFVQGRLSRDELADRAGQALEARTRAQLAAVSADIPAAQAAAAPPRPSEPLPVRTRGRPVSRKAIAWVLSSIIVLPGLSFIFVDTRYGGIIIILLLAFSAAVGLDLWDPPQARRHGAC